jgi:O-antigen/teichoic acid export membrane protein
VPSPGVEQVTSESANHGGDGLGTQVATGVLWTTAQKWLIRVGGLATLAILTRLITPDEFGVVAAAMATIPFMYLMHDAFSTFLAQSERIDQRVLSTSFWFSLAASFLLMLSTILAAPFVSVLTGISDLTPVLRVLSLSLLLSGLAAVPTALLRRTMAFRSLALQGAAAAVTAQIVAVALAFRGLGVWALVWQQIVMQAVAMVLAWRAAKWLPGFQFSASAARSMAGFGSRVSAADVFAAAREWGEMTMVAAALGATSLGYLSVARKFVWVVTELTTSALKPITVVVFSRVRDSPVRLQDGYLRALSLSYTVVAPLLTVVVVTAPILMPILFGDQWEMSIPLAQIVAVAAIFTLGAMLDQGLILGLGRPGTWLKYQVLQDLVALSVTAIAVRQGLTAVAWGILLSAIAATVGRLFIVGRLIACPVRMISRPLLQVVTTATLSGGLGLLTRHYVPSWWPPIAQLVVISLAVVGSSLALVRVLQGSILEYALGILPLPNSVVRGARRVLLLPS